MDPLECVKDNPYGDLSIVRQLLDDTLDHPPAGADEDYSLHLLLEKNKDIEQAIFGQLKDSLHHLHESYEWGLLTEEFVYQQRLRLYERAYQELNSHKRLCLSLAKEHGCYEGYKSEALKEINSSIDDYERIGELRFALLVWRATLERDLSLDIDAYGRLVKGYKDALLLIKRCTESSCDYWTAQRHGHAPSRVDVVRVERAAVCKVTSVLKALAGQYQVPLTELSIFGSDNDTGKLLNNEGTWTLQGEE